MADDGFLVEFGRYSVWLADAIEQLPPGDRVPRRDRDLAEDAGVGWVLEMSERVQREHSSHPINRRSRRN